MKQYKYLFIMSGIIVLSLWIGMIISRAITVSEFKDKIAQLEREVSDQSKKLSSALVSIANADARMARLDANIADLRVEKLGINITPTPAIKNITPTPTPTSKPTPTPKPTEKIIPEPTCTPTIQTSEVPLE